MAQVRFYNIRIFIGTAASSNGNTTSSADRIIESAKEKMPFTKTSSLACS